MAASKQVVLVGHFADWMTQPGAAMPTAWFGDAIHPNGLGHWHFARTLLQTLGAWDPSTGIGAESDTPANGLISNSSLELSQGSGLTQSYGYAFTGTFDGTRMEERSADLAGFPLHCQVEGTYAVRFTTTSAADGVLLSMSASSAPGSALTLRSVGGGVRALVTRNGATLLDLASGDLGLGDGREHTVALAAGNTTTRLTVDGVAVGFVPRQVFGADVVGADTLTVGATKTQTGQADGFVGSIGRVFALHEPTEPVQQVTLAGNNTVTRSAELTRMLTTLSQTGAWQSMESHLIAILGEGLSAPEDGWRRWSDTLQERHRGERNHRQDYVTTLSPGADDLPARVAWLLAQERLAGSRTVIMTAVEGDLQAAGGSAAYQAQAEAAVAALRTSTRIPLLMTSATAGSGTNDALRSAATASGAVLIDAEAEALQVGSGAVPPSWRSGTGLSGLGHERTAFRVLKGPRRVGVGQRRELASGGADPRHARRRSGHAGGPWRERRDPPEPRGRRDGARRRLPGADRGRRGSRRGAGGRILDGGDRIGAARGCPHGDGDWDRRVDGAHHGPGRRGDPPRGERLARQPARPGSGANGRDPGRSRRHDAPHGEGRAPGLSRGRVAAHPPGGGKRRVRSAELRR